MHKSNEAAPTIPAPSRDLLTQILRDGAQRLLGQEIEAAVADWIERHSSLTDGPGCPQVVRNGHHRQSEQSRHTLLLDCKQRGLTVTAATPQPPATQPGTAGPRAGRARRSSLRLTYYARR